MDPLLEQRLLICPSLPTLPAVAMEVLRLCREEDVDLALIAGAVSNDPALAARLLRAANSASLATRGQVGTVSRAVALLGSQTTLTICLSFSLLRMRRSGDGGGLDHPAFWRRAVFSALAGRALGEHLHLDPEETLLAALLQDVGMLALAAVLPEEYGALWREAGGDHPRLVELERRALGADHAEVTRLLLQRWNLPPALQEAALASHAPPGPAAAPDRGRQFLQAVHLSGPLADVWTSTSPGEAAARALAAAQARLGLGAEVISTILSRMAVAVPEAATDFEFDLGGPGRMESVLEEARASLAGRFGPAVAGAEDRAPSGREDGALDRTSALALGRAQARRKPLAALVATLEGTGEEGCPPQLLALLAGCIRRGDLVGALGASARVLLIDTAPDGAVRVAERILRQAEAAHLPVSIGLALHEPDEGFAAADDLLGAAESALAAAHRPGGGRLGQVRARHPVPVLCQPGGLP
ncbi:HDOD domain-containing protein [Anaeromyxobacter paludicola]|uniref:HDOD domain-containing protein n=1 Tax=Anaeromyxobacter paludicola TaxID=2918171 RepID=A0ABM7XC24_9BACT|nr:HDOD domain-containing protein [Anaeromyxobacter paludicola]BDG09362.1 hypothetical protein AMPC_24750 [Anaeromyxobacter paludicola]